MTQPWNSLARQSAWALAGITLLGAMLAACSVEFANLQPARDLAKERAQAAGDVYAGWRIYQDRCAKCHGVDAGGLSNAPDLRDRVRGLGPRSFATLVLARYDWAFPTAPARGDAAARDAWVDSVLVRQNDVLTMPAWQNEPAVSAHVMDLYAYLSGRAEGTVGTGRPGAAQVH